MTILPQHQSLTVDQAVERFRLRTVAELRALNEHLPGNVRLERAEVDGLVEDLLFAIKQTPKRRNASHFGRLVRDVLDPLAREVWRRSRRRKSAGHSPTCIQATGKARGYEESVANACSPRRQQAGVADAGAVAAEVEDNERVT